MRIIEYAAKQGDCEFIYVGDVTEDELTHESNAESSGIRRKRGLRRRGEPLRRNSTSRGSTVVATSPRVVEASYDYSGTLSRTHVAYSCTASRPSSDSRYTFSRPSTASSATYPSSASFRKLSYTRLSKIVIIGLGQLVADLTAIRFLQAAELDENVPLEASSVV